MALRIGRNKKMSLISSFCMYYLSFSPLWLTVLFIDIKSLIEGGDYKRTELISIALISIVLLATILYMVFCFNKTKNGFWEEYEIVKAEESKMITAEFLLAYILPLFAFDFRIWDQVVEFLIFFSVLGFLCIRHNYFSVNIVLELMNYRIYECTLKNKDGVPVSKIVISKNSIALRKGHPILLKLLNNDVLLDIKNS